MMKVPLPLAACAAMLVLSFAAPPARAAGDAVIANLGSRPVKASEIKDFIDGLTPQQREQATTNAKVMVQLVRAAIGRKLLIEEAYKKGWDKTPEVAEQIARARDQIVVTTYLRSIGAPPASFPSDADLTHAYDANRDHLTAPAQYHVAQIFVAEPANASPDASAVLAKKADDLAKRAKADPASFTDLAKNNSDDKASAAKGGDLGWLPETEIVPDILAALKANGDKGVAGPIHIAGGWHIISVLGVEPAKSRSFEEVRDQLATALRENQINQNDQSYIDRLLDEKHLTINETAATALFTARK